MHTHCSNAVCSYNAICVLHKLYSTPCIIAVISMYNVDVNMYGCFRNNTPSQYGEQLLALEGSVVNKGHVVQSMPVCPVRHKEVHTIPVISSPNQTSMEF